MRTMFNEVLAPMEASDLKDDTCPDKEMVH